MLRPLIQAGLVFGLLVALASQTACRPANPAQAPTTAPVKVRVAVVESRPRTVMEEVVGSVRSKLHASVEAKVSGKIERMLAVPGQSVKTGDLLVELDARDLRARLDQALAVREQANQEYRRASNLLKDKTISEQEFDLARSRARVADATVAEVETTLSYARIVAPFSGLVTRKLADVGDLAAPGKTIVELEDSTALRLEADLPESFMEHIQLGDKLPVRIGSMTNEVEAVTSEITPAVDPGSRTFLVKLDLPALKGARSGQFGRLLVPIGQGAALRVPAASVVQRGQMELIFVVTDGRAHLRLIKTGKRIGEELEVVSGLEANEQIVSEEPERLQDGQRVSAR